MLVIQGSPHPQGVSDALALAALRGAESGKLLAVRDFTIIPCCGCNWCAEARLCRYEVGHVAGSEACKLQDQAHEVFAAISAAEAVIISAPIYFYALPGSLKSFMDRAQVYWHLPRKQQRKKAAALLVAGRRKGEQLFLGAQLSLRYFFEILGFELCETLTFPGLDSVSCLDSHPQYLAKAHQLGAKLSH